MAQEKEYVIRFLFLMFVYLTAALDLCLCISDFIAYPENVLKPH